MAADSRRPEHKIIIQHCKHNLAFTSLLVALPYNNNEIMVCTSDMCLHLFLNIMAITNVRNFSSDTGSIPFNNGSKVGSL